MLFGVAAGYQRHVVDIGDAGGHTAAVHPEPALLHGCKVGRLTGVQVFRVKPVDQYHNDGGVHVVTCQSPLRGRIRNFRPACIGFVSVRTEARLGDGNLPFPYPKLGVQFILTDRSDRSADVLFRDLQIVKGQPGQQKPAHDAVVRSGADVVGQNAVGHERHDAVGALFG